MCARAWPVASSTLYSPGMRSTDQGAGNQRDVIRSLPQLPPGLTGSHAVKIPQKPIRGDTSRAYVARRPFWRWLGRLTSI